MDAFYRLTGSFGCVVLAKNSVSGELVAIKKMVSIVMREKKGLRKVNSTPKLAGGATRGLCGQGAGGAAGVAFCGLAAHGDVVWRAPDSLPTHTQEREYLQGRYVESETLNHSILRHPHVSDADV